MLSEWEKECAGKAQYGRENYPCLKSNPAYMKGWANAMLEDFGSADDAGLFMGKRIAEGFKAYNPFPKGTDEERRFSITLVEYLTTKY